MGVLNYEMKKTLLLFAVALLSSPAYFAHGDLERKAKNFDYQWNEYLLPDCSFYPYHGANESYFIDALNNRVAKHSYMDIKTGGQHHYIVQTKEGYHLLDTNLKLVTNKAYDGIELKTGREIELTLGNEKSYYVWNPTTKSYGFTNEKPLSLDRSVTPPAASVMLLGQVTDNRFKQARSSQLENHRTQGSNNDDCNQDQFPGQCLPEQHCQ